MKAILCVVLMFAAVGVFAQDVREGQMWGNFTDEQKAIFFMGFVYGVVSEAYEQKTTDYGISTLDAEDYEFVIGLVTMSFIMKKDLTLREAILTSIRAICELKGSKQ